MSINWMIKKPGTGDVVEPQELPGEHFHYHTGDISISVTSADGAVALKCSSLKIWLSYQRIVLSTEEPVTYKVTEKGTGISGDARFENLIVPLAKIKEVQLDQPWFGPNGVKCLFLAVPNGNLPDNIYTLVVTFKSGGSFDFYENLTEARQGESLPAYREG